MRKKRMYKKSNKSFWGKPMADKSPLPNTFKTTLRYQENGLTLNPGIAGIVDSHVISCNGLFDPDISGTGHQPLGFDQLMVMYSHYTVIGAKIRITFANGDSSNFQTVGSYISAVTTEQSDLRILVENGGCQYKTLSPKGGSRDMCTIVQSINPPKWLGRSKPLAVDELRGSASANPTEQCYFHVFAGEYAQGTDSSAVVANIQVDYVVVFTEPKQLSLS